MEAQSNSKYLWVWSFNYYFGLKRDVARGWKSVRIVPKNIIFKN